MLSENADLQILPLETVHLGLRVAQGSVLLTSNSVYSCHQASWGSTPPVEMRSTKDLRPEALSLVLSFTFLISSLWSVYYWDTLIKHLVHP